MQRPPPPAYTSVVVRPEIKLHTSAKERRKFEDMADLYAIIKTTEHLEKAYIRDAITEKEYEHNCNKLIAQYKTAEKGLMADGTLTDASAFVAKYKMDCPRGIERLLHVGVPANVLHRSTGGGDGNSHQHTAEATQCFITAMDALKLEERDVDSIQPLISDVMASLSKVSGLPVDFEGKAKVLDWLKALNSMRAAQAISEEQARQLSFDLDTSYTAFHRCLAGAGAGGGS